MYLICLGLALKFPCSTSTSTHPIAHVTSQQAFNAVIAELDTLSELQKLDPNHAIAPT
jgi:hypothetical protein